jgi:hypothetical protein
MRAGNRSDDTRERYLGELAPLLEAARQVDSFPPVQKRRLRRRIVRTLFGSRRWGMHALIGPVLTALLLLALGGAAFATAQRLGLLPRLGREPARAPAGESAGEAHKRRSPRLHRAAPALVAAPAPAAAVPAAAEPAVTLPEVPDPLLFPPSAAASTSVWAPLEVQGKASSPSPPVRAATAIGASQRSPRPIPPPNATPVARRTGQAPDRQIAMVSHQPGLPSHALRALNPSLAPALAYPAPSAAPARVGAAAPSSPLPAAAPAAPPAPPPSADRPMHLPAIAPPVPATAPKPALSDPAMFGQAMRKLRAEQDPAGALAILREHGKAYPKSPLAGERGTLEVEALLDLHREREALALLDGMALEGLPRSGERLVVRGELRAAARRWLEANQDFESALSRTSGSPAWHERALWGRGVSRLRLGQREGGMADVEQYLDTYPQGRFAGEAAKFFPNR